MKLLFEEALIAVWRQTLMENAKTVELGSEHYPVRSTPKRGLRQVDFVFDENEIRGLEQNPQTKSQWAQLARSTGVKQMMPTLIAASAFPTSSRPRLPFSISSSDIHGSAVCTTIGSQS